MGRAVGVAPSPKQKALRQAVPTGNRVGQGKQPVFVEATPQCAGRQDLRSVKKNLRQRTGKDRRQVPRVNLGVEDLACLREIEPRRGAALKRRKPEEGQQGKMPIRKGYGRMGGMGHIVPFVSPGYRLLHSVLTSSKKYLSFSVRNVT
ncbi:hypothetical protein JANAI62_36640 [Jannaschia pagri]|uniref:Uncharacterized protein n=1 Tax=Jannaschia pagri TaxID=2829797 RepID=A0ABQ4NRJ9_9RHOB|nr:hypothetical protein JANAI61_36500 [Jannaschia sp. AI_61]GIT97041.1 hypothetical protein JANAI62_36640 [Jannaschia sp. AI_62]